MFNLGMGEILVLGVIALIVVGPEKLPGLARNVGRFINDIKRTTSDVTREISRSIDEQNFNQNQNRNQNVNIKESESISSDPLNEVHPEEDFHSNHPEYDDHHAHHHIDEHAEEKLDSADDQLKGEG